MAIDTFDDDNLAVDPVRSYQTPPACLCLLPKSSKLEYNISLQENQKKSNE